MVKSRNVSGNSRTTTVHPPVPELSPEFNAPAEDVSFTQMCAPLSRSGGHHPDEKLMLKLESYSEFPIIIDLTRRCFYYGESGFRADEITVLGWNEWIEDNGAESGYGSWYDYWAAAGMAVSLDDVDAGEQIPYWYAFLEPPQWFDVTPDDFRRVNEALFPEGTDALEVFEWTTDWSNHFDAGHEWWGTACWSVYDKHLDRFVVMFASATD